MDNKITYQINKSTEDWSPYFYASETMKITLKQCVKYAFVSGIDSEDILKKMCDEGRLPARDKKDGLQEADFRCFFERGSGLRSQKRR